MKHDLQMSSTDGCKTFFVVAKIEYIGHIRRSQDGGWTTVVDCTGLKCVEGEMIPHEYLITHNYFDSIYSAYFGFVEAFEMTLSTIQRIHECRNLSFCFPTNPCYNRKRR